MLALLGLSTFAGVVDANSGTPNAGSRRIPGACNSVRSTPSASNTGSMPLPPPKPPVTRFAQPEALSKESLPFFRTSFPEPNTPDTLSSKPGLPASAASACRAFISCALSNNARMESPTFSATSAHDTSVTRVKPPRKIDINKRAAP